MTVSICRPYDPALDKLKNPRTKEGEDLVAKSAGTRFYVKRGHRAKSSSSRESL